VAALVLAGCGAATSNGFSAQPPGGWKDETDNAETRTGTELEVVYEGPAVDGVLPSLTVSRVPLPKGGSLEKAAGDARSAVDRRIEEADPTPIVRARLGGEAALRFDFRAAGMHSRYLTASHGGHLYAVTVQSAEESFHRALIVFDDYVASWRWDD
jgi:hypothetical protein